MAFEIVHLFKRVEFEADTDGVMTFELKTDQPGDELAVRYTQNFNTDTTATKRRVVRFKLPGTTKGALYRAKVYGVNVGRLFGGRILARPLGTPGAGGWNWYPMPIEETPEAYSKAALPIRPTVDWSSGKLPIVETPLVPRWYDIPLDHIE